MRPLSIIASSSNMLVVHPSIPVSSVAEFVAYAKHPNAISYAHGGHGSPGHLTMELFRTMAGFSATPVPYRGNAPTVRLIWQQAKSRSVSSEQVAFSITSVPGA